MTVALTRRRSLVAAALLVTLFWAVKGPAADQAAAPVTDAWCGFSIAVGEPWRKAPLSAFRAPGVIRCAWTQPNGSAVIVFLQEPGTAVSPRAILDGSVSTSKSTLGATVSTGEVRTVARMQAMWMVLSGKGTGGALDGKGNVDTTQHWVAVPRERDAIVVLLSCRSADYPQLRKSFEDALESLKLEGSQTAEQKAAK